MTAQRSIAIAVFGISAGALFMFGFLRAPAAPKRAGISPLDSIRRDSIRLDSIARDSIEHVRDSIARLPRLRRDSSSIVTPALPRKDPPRTEPLAPIKTVSKAGARPDRDASRYSSTKSPASTASTPSPAVASAIPAVAKTNTPAPTPARFDNMHLIIPVQGIRASQLRDTYSDARGSGRKHDAIDIMAAHNTPVLAAVAATVIKRDNGARGGIAMYALADDKRTVYYYAHLDRYAPGIVEGKRIEAGDVIGYVGDTGNAGPGNYHLHFEITTTSDPKRYWGGASINPFPILRAGITRN